MVMALEMCRVMVGLSLMALWYSVEQSVSVKPADIKGRQNLKEHFKFQVALWVAVNKYAVLLKTKDAILHSMNNP